ncbi:MAG: helix-turn-helix domain-containing protein [Firmicutes bacterium]|nr:helix-turn-helix domain-containing protein [Bacillota bacterium]
MKNKYDIGDFVPTITEQSVKNEIVKRFKIRRKEFGITQRELSERSGVSYASIRRFETSGEISLHALLRISVVIDCLEDFNGIYKNPIVKDIRR